MSGREQTGLYRDTIALVLNDLTKYILICFEGILEDAL